MFILFFCRVDRFAGVVFKFVYFFFISIYGFYLLRDREWLPSVLGGSGDIANCFRGLPFPFAELDAGLKTYYLVQFSYHAHSFLFQVISPVRNNSFFHFYLSFILSFFLSFLFFLFSSFFLSPFFSLPRVFNYLMSTAALPPWPRSRATCCSRPTSSTTPLISTPVQLVRFCLLGWFFVFCLCVLVL